MSVLRSNDPHAVNRVCVGTCGQGRPLDGSSLLDTVVPQDNLTGVRTAKDQVRVKTGKGGGHHLRENKQDR